MSDHESESGFLEVSSDLGLFFRWHGVPDARAVLLIIHGFAEHSGRYITLIRSMMERGYSCLAIDSRGHGKSGGRRGFINSYGDYGEDLDVALAAARERAAGLPVVLVGHSQGGLIVSWYAIDRAPPGVVGGEPPFSGVAALVLSGPLFALGMKTPAWKEVLGSVASRILPGLGVPAGIPPEGISRDPRIVQAYIDDPLVFTSATARWYTESVAAMKRCMQEAGEIRLPVLAMHGMDDAIVSPSGTERFVELLGSQDKTFKPYPGLLHEIFNEPEQDRVFTDVADWLDERVAAGA